MGPFSQPPASSMFTVTVSPQARSALAWVGDDVAGAPVGVAVGEAVGDAVCAAVGDAVGEAVGDAV